jgi:lipopolysaccharide transport system permease protein
LKTVSGEILVSKECSQMQQSEEQWTIIHSGGRSFDIRCITDVFKYRSLLAELTKKRIRSVYTQTVLGPLWLIIQPFLTTVVFVLILQKMIGIPVQGRSSFVFYSSAVVLWGYFAKSVNAVSNVFISNRHIFSKLSFPKFVVPLAEIFANLIKFTFQFTVLLIVYCTMFRKSFTEVSPVSVLCCAAAFVEVTLFAIGTGLVAASLTTIFRDTSIMVSYGVNLLFYATPILYPVNKIPADLWKILKFNPMTSAIDLFRFPFSGSLSVSGGMITSGAMVSLLLFVIGLILFVVTQRSCVDKI